MTRHGLLSKIAFATLTVGALTITACTGEQGLQGPIGPAGQNGKDGTNGIDGANGRDGTNGTNGTNGRDGVDGTNGTNGTNGTSCTVTSDGNGTSTISCTDGTHATVSDGTDGTNGTNGTNGLDGSSCSVRDNGNGTKTISCTDGTTVTVSDGKNGKDGLGVEVENFHGMQHLMESGEYENGAKYLANVNITSATADAAGVVTVNFTAHKEMDDSPVLGLTTVSAAVAKLAAPGTGEVSSKWVSYIYRTETVSTAGDWPAAVGTTAIQAYREDSGGTLTDHGDGSYTYVFGHNIANVTSGGNPVTYERNRLHRVSIMMGGHAGATGNAELDFVPDGSAAPATRNIVDSTPCRECHGPMFAGHGGDRMTLSNCVMCHTAGSNDANSGESLDMKVMIHKIHAGGELASIPGADGIVWDNPTTVADESADNGHYAIWGYRNSKHEWWKAEFPAVIENCQKCHAGTGGDTDNWKTKPSRAACGSCHDTINWATGTNHAGGPQTNDSSCALCHPASGTPGGFSFPVEQSHDWTVKDERNIPEFDVSITMSAPANGQYYVTGEAPTATIVLSQNGTPIDHTTVRQDTAAEGCQAGVACPAPDGLFATANFFVSGPRATRNPVLTQIARASIVAPTAGPYDISAAGANLVITIDGGKDLIRYDQTGGDVTYVGTITVNVSAGTFVNRAAATPAEIVTWLNANTAFRRRAIAYLDEATGRPAIRSRNLGTFYSVQLTAGAVTTAVFGGDVAVHVIGGSTASNNVTQRTNPALNDPKVTWTTGAIVYHLDPVDDLAPGTYIASIEIGDRGRISATDYKTPSVAVTPFQVKQAAEEKPVARNCNSCHQAANGKGFILDFSRHNKKFGDYAVDQCGACHDYQSQSATGSFAGAKSIVRRVHAVHFGSELNYPLATTGYANGDPIPGRNWDIEFPQDVRNCQSCHPDNTSSGTWKTKPARLPCGGCHDSDAATAHMNINTYDLTPAAPFSGDEVESCATCH